jgi:hypothetical protein
MRARGKAAQHFLNQLGRISYFPQISTVELTLLEGISAFIVVGTARGDKLWRGTTSE